MTDLTHILNWRRIAPRITTSGQPTETQLSEIKALGVTHIINLGPHHNKGALKDEAGTVAALEMSYIYIPVAFEQPTDQNFADFQAALENNPDTNIHVHCIYNARVSAFFYRYAKLHSDLPETRAFEIMESIWKPGNDWADFIDAPNARGLPNRYAGEDY